MSSRILAQQTDEIQHDRTGRLDARIVHSFTRDMDFNIR